MISKPTTAHVDRLVAHTVASLPDSLRERKILLVTLHALAPRDYEHRDDIMAMVEALRQHEELQLKFSGLIGRNGGTTTTK